MTSIDLTKYWNKSRMYAARRPRRAMQRVTENELRARTNQLEGSYEKTNYIRLDNYIEWYV